MIENRKNRIKNRVGEIGYNKSGSKMKIIEYINSNNIVVEFENGYKVKNSLGNFKKGLIKNPYDRTIYGIGYIGIENYKNVKNVSYEKAYSIWRDMLYRCYDKKHQLKRPKYAQCTVCEEWHNYAIFKEWFEKNYYELENERVHLDKDILISGNNVYGPKTCIFVPQTINQLFQGHKKSLKHPPGIKEYLKEKYIAIYRNNITKKYEYSKQYETIEKARQEYVRLKKQYLLDIIEHYKKQIPKKLYNKLLEYGENYNV